MLLFPHHVQLEELVVNEFKFEEAIAADTSVKLAVLAANKSPAPSTELGGTPVFENKGIKLVEFSNLSFEHL